jgi:hypothetical protein
MMRKQRRMTGAGRDGNYLREEVPMKNRTLAVLALAALAATAACKDNTSEGDEKTTSDTTVVAGTDTAAVPTVVPTTDSVVTTTTTETDTIHGEAGDTVAHDTTKKM